MAHLMTPSFPDMPWQDRPEGYTKPVWRYTGNPIIPRDAIPSSNSIFNSAVVPFVTEGTDYKYAGVFRCDDREVSMNIFAGFSVDGIHWDINHDPIVFQGEDPEVTHLEYRYDPRVLWIEDRFYISWCNGYHGPTIGLGYTFDFKTFYQLENAFLPYNRNGVLFPRKIHGNYAMLSRPSDTGHTPFGDMFYSESPDLTFWGKHRFVFGTAGGWQSTKIGPGPCPIETDEGWLLIYHGVLTSCNGYVYRFGVALLDKDQPWKVLKRSRYYIMGPEESYELTGDVPNVTFPCATLTDGDTGRIAIYYGCADTVTGLAFTTIDTLMEHLDKYPMK